jgi:hypothetical protein
MTYRIVKSGSSIGLKSVFNDPNGFSIGLLEDWSGVRGFGAVLQLLRQCLAINLSLFEKKIKNRIRQNHLPHCLTPLGSGVVHAFPVRLNRVTGRGEAQ